VEPPRTSRAILNVHYKVPHGMEEARMLGLINAPAHWVFVRGGVASVTVSAAQEWLDQSSNAIADALWPDVARALELETAQTPRHRVIKERRATFAQTPDALVHRPSTRTAFDNFFFAGDWTATGLPSTIEGAIRSGQTAARSLRAGSVVRAGTQVRGAA